MKEVIHFICEICGTEYSDKARAKRCEMSHRHPAGINTSEWRSIADDATGYPQYVTVSFDNGKIVKYKKLRVLGE